MVCSLPKCEGDVKLCRLMLGAWAEGWIADGAYGDFIVIFGNSIFYLLQGDCKCTA